MHTPRMRRQCERLTATLVRTEYSQLLLVEWEYMKRRVRKLQRTETVSPDFDVGNTCIGLGRLIGFKMHGRRWGSCLVTGLCDSEEHLPQSSVSVSSDLADTKFLCWSYLRIYLYAI